MVSFLAFCFNPLIPCLLNHLEIEEESSCHMVSFLAFCFNPLIPCLLNHLEIEEESLLSHGQFPSLLL